MQVLLLLLELLDATLVALDDVRVLLGLFGMVIELALDLLLESLQLGALLKQTELVKRKNGRLTPELNEMCH